MECRSPTASGGLEEAMTDFDAWLTKRRWMFRRRSYQRPDEKYIQEKTGRIENRRPNAFVSLQESLVNGLYNRKTAFYPEKDLIAWSRICRHSTDTVHLDFVLFRLLKENGRRRVLLSRSKL